MNLFQAVAEGNINVIKKLLKEGVDVNTQYDNKWTALMLASRYSNSISNIETVKLLLENGADPNLQNVVGETPLVYASLYSGKSSNIETVKLLLENGADPNLQNNKWTPLIVASLFSNDTSSLETVKLLLENGADPNLKSNIGKTALMFASKHSNETSSLETVQLLLENGANPFIKSNVSITALDLCPTKKCRKLISEYMWKQMYQNVKLLSRQYSRSGVARFPKEIWELILLRNKQQQLCKNLSNPENREILANFALLLEVPVNETMSKADLCRLVSRQLTYGERYSEKSVKYFKTKEGLKQVGLLAKTLGVNANQPIEIILNDITKVLTE